MSDQEDVFKTANEMSPGIPIRIIPRCHPESHIEIYALENSGNDWGASNARKALAGLPPSHD